MKPTKKKFYHRTFSSIVQMLRHIEKPVSYTINRYTGSVNARFTLCMLVGTLLFSSCATTIYSAGPNREGRCNIYGHKYRPAKGPVFINRF